MVFSRPLISTSSSLFNNPLVNIPKAPITIAIIATFMFHYFFNSLSRSRYLSFFSHSFRFILWSAGTTKSTILPVFLFLLINIRSGLLVEIRWSVSMSKCVIFYDRCLVVHIPFIRMVKFKFLAHLPVDHLAHSVVSCLVLFLCIHLLCDSWFRLYHRIANICYFVTSYLFLLWYDWFSWRCFVLQLEEILFLSLSFHLLATSMFSLVRCCLLVI